MNRTFFISFILTISTVLCYGGEKDTVILNRTLYAKGMFGYSAFRIPAIIYSKAGTLLAFAEGRKDSDSDTGNIDLLLRRSSDNGATWSDPAIVWDDGNHVCGNPAPVVDSQSGRIFLLSTWNLGEDHEKDILRQKSKDTRRIFILYSDDDGISWSEPREITDMVKRPEWTWYATGPCHAIQLRKAPYKGRLVVPCDFGTFDGTSTMYQSLLIYSDDLGENWHIGGISSKNGNECSAVELSDGKVMLNMREQNKNAEFRQQIGYSRGVAISDDGGETLGETTRNSTLIEPVCQGSIINYAPKGKLTNTILFSNPNHTSKRQNMTVKISRDSGKTWGKQIKIFEQKASYSDLAILPTGEVAIIYECGEQRADDRIEFSLLNKSLFK